MAGRRVMDRKKRRMPCELLVESRVHSGLVLDLSPSGLFVQTNAKTHPGQAIDLRLSTGVGDPIPLKVEVVRKKVVPPRLLTLTQGGIGVRILSAPESYYAFLCEIGIRGRPPAAGPAPGQRFRVRVKQTSGPRSRSLDVEAADAESAGERALEALGDDWKILDVEAL